MLFQRGADCAVRSFEDVVCGAIELYCIIQIGVTVISPSLIIRNGMSNIINTFQGGTRNMSLRQFQQKLGASYCRTVVVECIRFS